ncbi:MAG: roadblock/LC7 domain-containing protein [Candidatus Helarchaeota archaeon]
MLAEKTLQKFLNRLKSNTGVNNALLLTEDGLLIAADETSDKLENKDEFIKISAVSAGIISMSERVIELITNKNLNQILLKSGKDSERESMTIILTLLYENIILLVLFPSEINIGLVFYEIEQIKIEINKFMTDHGNEIILNQESVL